MYNVVVEALAVGITQFVDALADVWEYDKITPLAPDALIIRY